MTVAFPPAHALYEQDLANARAQLDAEELEACWAQGRMMTMGEAVAEALAEYTQVPPKPRHDVCVGSKIAAVGTIEAEGRTSP